LPNTKQLTCSTQRERRKSTEAMSKQLIIASRRSFPQCWRQIIGNLNWSATTVTYWQQLL